LGVLNNIPFAIPFDVRVAIFRHFVAGNMAGRRYTYRRGTRVRIRRGNVAEDGFDKLEEANLKEPIEITFIDQFGQEEYVYRLYFFSLIHFDCRIGLVSTEAAFSKNSLHPSARKFSTLIAACGLQRARTSCTPIHTHMLQNVSCRVFLNKQYQWLKNSWVSTQLRVVPFHWQDLGESSL
jgi:hypothetical protein